MDHRPRHTKKSIVDAVPDGATRSGTDLHESLPALKELPIRKRTAYGRWSVICLEDSELWESDLSLEDALEERAIADLDCDCGGSHRLVPFVNGETLTFSSVVAPAYAHSCRVCGGDHTKKSCQLMKAALGVPHAPPAAPSTRSPKQHVRRAS